MPLTALKQGAQAGRRRGRIGISQTLIQQEIPSKEGKQRSSPAETGLSCLGYEVSYEGQRLDGAGHPAASSLVRHPGGHEYD
jgi:hypothetical protein